MKVPRLLHAGSAADPLVVVRSPFWHFNAIGVFAGDEAAVIDPGIYPEDIALLHAALATRARKGAPRRVTHVVVTHSHHDHIRGWSSFPGAHLTLPRVAAEKPPEAQRRILAAKAAIDARLEIDDPGFTYPALGRPDHGGGTTVFDERARIALDGLELEVRFLPGHSNCTSVVWIAALRTLCTADYLVTPGLPYCRWAAQPFEEALRALRRWVDEDGVERVVPAHNEVLEGRAAIHAALDAEEACLRALRGAVRAGLERGLGEHEILRSAAAAAAARRTRAYGAQERQDLDNARRVLDEERALRGGPQGDVGVTPN